MACNEILLLNAVRNLRTIFYTLYFNLQFCLYICMFVYGSQILLVNLHPLPVNIELLNLKYICITQSNT